MAADIPVAEPTDVLHLLEPLLREILSAYCSVLLTGRAPGSHTAKWEWEKGEKRVAINSRACYTKSQTAAQRDWGENFLSSGSLASMPGGKRTEETPRPQNGALVVDRVDSTGQTRTQTLQISISGVQLGT